MRAGRFVCLAVVVPVVATIAHAAVALAEPSAAGQVGQPAGAHAARGLTSRPLWPIEGAFLDVQAVAAAGIGLDGKLPFPLQTSGRAGIGYATEPWSFAFGGTAAIGGGFDLAFGAELEVNHFAGPYVDLGMAFDTDGFAVAHATLGFAVVGLQATARFAGPQPRYGLLACLRLPLGLSWFLDEQQASALTHGRAAARPRPAPLDARARPADANARVPPSARAARALEQAAEAEAQGRLPDAEAALSRALSHANTPANRLRRADLRERAGRYVAARADLLYVLAEKSSQVSSEQRLDINGRLRRLMGKVGFVRLMPHEADAPDRIEVDNLPSAALLQGADHVVDPGRHHIRGLHAGALLWEVAIDVGPGEIVRVTPPAPAATTLER